MKQRPINQTYYYNYWQDSWKRLLSNPVAILGLCILSFLILMAIIGPHLNQYAYYETHLDEKNQFLSAQFWFGTDELGRDLFTRVWWGARISLVIAIVASFADLVIGIFYGALAASIGGKTEEFMMRLIDIFQSIPALLITILAMVIIGPGILTIIIILTIIGWTNMARIIRGQILQLKESDFVKAAQVLGASRLRIILRHFIPNAMGSIIVTLTFTIPSAIFAEAFLSFLGLGVQAPIASWGTMASDGLSAMRYHPWRFFFPAGFISLTVLSFNLIGDSMRDAFDPRLSI